MFTYRDYSASKREQQLKRKGVDDPDTDQLDEPQKIKLGGAARKRYAWLVSNGYPQGHATRLLALKPMVRGGREKRDVSDDVDDSPVDSQPAKSGPTQGCTDKSSEKSSSSFKQAVKSVTIGVVPVEYPNTSLNIEQMRAIQDTVEEKILDQRDRELKPGFHGIGFKAGWMSFECFDENTVMWMEVIISNIQPWEGARLKVVKGEDLPRANIVVANFPNCSHMKTDKILAFIDSQNNGVRTGSWRVVSRKDEGTIAVITFALDPPTSELLKKREFKIYFRYGIVQLKSRGALKKDDQTWKPEEKKADPTDLRANGDSATPCLQKSADVKINSKRQRRRERQKEQEVHKKASTGAISKVQSSKPRHPPSANSRCDQQPSTSRDTSEPSGDSRPGKWLRPRTVQPAGYQIFTRARTGSNGQRGGFRK